MSQDTEAGPPQAPPDATAFIAWAAAGALCASMQPEGVPTPEWIDCGAPGELVAELATDARDRLAAFVRANPAISGETLFRYAAGQGLHAASGDDFDAIGVHWRAAYATFVRVLLVLDEERARAQAHAAAQAFRAQQAASGPPVSAAFSGDREDALDRLSGGIGDRIDAPRGAAAKGRKGKGK